jgi:hypothetical protein
MTDEDWGDIREAGSSKGIPFWVWGCGGGCLLFIVLIVAAGFWGYGFVKDAINPDIAWTNVEQLVDFDERHPDFALIFGAAIPFTEMEVYVFQQLQEDAPLVDENDLPLSLESLQLDEDGLIVVLQLNASEDPSEEDMEAMEITDFPVTIQGVEFEATRLEITGDTDGYFAVNWGGDDKGDPSPMVIVNLSEVLDQEDLVAIIMRANGGDEPTEADVQHFFAPFHIGPDR